MSWLTPLGFLGLISIIILIIIYILKPNYQQKFISSTFIWELSLKYKRKKIPISKFRNILIFICQVLILTSCAFILAQPFLPENVPPVIVEKVAIIDASANMQVAYNKETRFERALFEAGMLAEETFEEEGYFTLIIAGPEASYYAQRVSVDESMDFLLSLEELEEGGCSYGKADIEGAVELAQRIVDQNASTEVYFYTANEYLDDGGNIEIVPVSVNGEWNAAILNCEAVLDENYYTFKVTLAVYDRDADIRVGCKVEGINGTATSVEIPVQPKRCMSDQVVTFSIETKNSETPIFEFEAVRIFLNESDSFGADNDFYIYGEKKPELNVLYFNPNANIFVGGALMTARATLTDWSMNFKEINQWKGETADIPVEGYDFYVYENRMPNVLPATGVVMLINMDEVSTDLPIVCGNDVTGEFQLAIGETHPLNNRLQADNILVTKYNKLLQYDGFTPVLYCAGDPVLLIKETAERKIIIMNFSFAYSLVSLYVEFPMLIYNIFDYLLPPTMSKFAYEVNEPIKLNARGEQVTVEGANNGYKQTIKELPTQISMTDYGTYTVTQDAYGKTVSEKFFVRIPQSESNISQTYDTMYELLVPKKEKSNDLDLVLYFAAALVALVFIERILHSKSM